MRRYFFSLLLALFVSVVWLASGLRLLAQTTLFSDGFEGSASLAARGWLLYNDPANLAETPPPPVNPSWGIVNSAFGSESTRGGSNKVYCAGLGFGGTTTYPTYPGESSVVNMVRTNIDLRNYNRATLSFWYKQEIPSDFETYEDYMKVYVKEGIEEGNEYEVFSTEGLDVKITEWTRVSISLDEYAGGTVAGPIEIRFEFTTDESNDERIDPEFPEDNVYERDFEGVYLDDVVVTGENLKDQPRHDLDIVTDFFFQHTNGALGSWSVNPVITGASPIFFTNLTGFFTAPTNILSGTTNFLSLVSNVFTNIARSRTNTNYIYVVTNLHTNLYIFKEIVRTNTTMDQGRVTPNPLGFGTNHFRGARRIGNALGFDLEPDWQVMGHSDFNQDGLSDLLLQNANGVLAVGYMAPTNTHITASNNVINTSFTETWQQTNFVMVSTNTLITNTTGSGSKKTTNILWTNFSIPNITLSSTNLSSTNVSSVNQSYTNPLQSVVLERIAIFRQASPGWRVVSITDMNNDGKRDFIFQHTDSRAAVWFMNGTNFLSSSLLGNGAVSTGFKIVGVADMNGDGQKDVIFQLGNNGSLRYWRMSSLSQFEVQSLTATTESNVVLSKDWRVVQLTDYNGDRLIDFVAQHTDGRMAIWYNTDVLVGTVMTPRITSSLLLRPGARVSPGWRGIGPR